MRNQGSSKGSITDFVGPRTIAAKIGIYFGNQRAEETLRYKFVSSYVFQQDEKPQPVEKHMVKQVT